MAEYDIALRPYADERGIEADELLDDIVVNDVSCFRAEDMDGKHWFACCYLRGGERIAFWLTAKKHPLRIEWVATELPEGDFTYEDTAAERAAALARLERIRADRAQ